MTFEAPQKGNPHKLTVNQHTFPSASIARFVNEKGAVQVVHKPSERKFHAKPPDSVFCAQRLWDQQAEEGFMKRIEDTFQEFASEVLDNPTLRLGPQHFSVINEFYCLWNIRADRRKAGHMADHSIASPEIIGLRREFTKDDQEQLEAAGVGFIRPDFTIPGRTTVAQAIRRNLARAVQMMRDETWEILQVDDGELLVPDNFFNWYAVPLSPTACLWAHGGFPSGRLDRQAVTEYNRAAVATSNDYYFGRDLDHCPL